VSRYCVAWSFARVAAVTGPASTPAAAAYAMNTQQPEEIVVSGGMQLPPPTDLSVFLALVPSWLSSGGAESVTVTFLPGDTDHVYTRITLSPDRVFERGLTRRRRCRVGNWRIVRGRTWRPADAQPRRSREEHEIGGLYFVPTAACPFLRYLVLQLLRNGDALVRLDAEALVGMSDRQGWVRACDR